MRRSCPDPARARPGVRASHATHALTRTRRSSCRCFQIMAGEAHSCGHGHCAPPCKGQGVSPSRGASPSSPTEAKAGERRHSGKPWIARKALDTDAPNRGDISCVRVFLALLHQTTVVKQVFRSRFARQNLVQKRVVDCLSHDPCCPVFCVAVWGAMWEMAAIANVNAKAAPQPFSVKRQFHMRCSALQYRVDPLRAMVIA